MQEQGIALRAYGLNQGIQDLRILGIFLGRYAEERRLVFPSGKGIPSVSG